MPASSVDASPRPTRPTPVALSELAAGRGHVVGDDVPVTGITAASTLVRPGDLFAALPGRNAHGAAYAGDALGRGAAAVLTDEAGAALLDAGVPHVVVPDVRVALGPVSAQVYGSPADRLVVFGVTGTSGKTTTTFLMRAGLCAAGHTVGLIGTVATMIGDEVLESGFTTPEAPELQALLAVMAERGVGVVVMEVSSHAVAMHRVDGIRFDVGGFTNLSEDHLDFHADMEDYFAAKLSFVAGAELAATVVDDEWGRRVSTETGAVTISTTADTLGESTWARAEDVRESPTGTTTFRALGPWGARDVGCAIPGRYNVANVMLALSLLHLHGVTGAAVAEAISTAQVPGRMERVDAGQDYLAVVDYSHKPAAVDGALRALRPLTAGRLIIALGCGGDRDRGKRPHMGEIAARAADVLIVTDDNPRSEDPALIRRAMLAGAATVPSGQRGEIVEIGDRGAAIADAVRRASAGDTVLIAGKGHETGQEVAGTVHPFDDRVVLREAIEANSMIPLTLREIAEIVGGSLSAADPDAVVTGTVEFDTRTVTPGGLFVAFAGEQVDGHDFVGRAVEAGAVASIVTRPVDGPSIEVTDALDALARLAAAVVRRLPATVVGVTGSSGKTSTKDLIAQLLAPDGPTVAPPGSFNNELGHPYTVLRATSDTRFLVLENSARGIGHIRYLTQIAPPRVAAVLNVGSAHLGEFGSREAIAQAKGELVEALPPDDTGGVAVLNADDPLVLAMRERTSARVVTFGLAATADVRATDVTLDPLGRARFTLLAGGEALPVALRVAGAHQVSNALAAAAVALECGVSPADVAARLGTATAASRWRMELTERADGVLLVNDAYNANPESMTAALETLARIGAARSGATWAVLGPMAELGADAAAEQAAIGRRAAELGVAHVLAVGDPARPTCDAAALEGSWAGEARWVPDVDAALEILRGEVRGGDAVLVKASRSASLERIAIALAEDEQAAPTRGDER